MRSPRADLCKLQRDGSWQGCRPGGREEEGWVLEWTGIWGVMGGSFMTSERHSDFLIKQINSMKEGGNLI